ncbi:hypothetical protein ACFX12_012353 [Malus domestica]
MAASLLSKTKPLLHAIQRRGYAAASHGSVAAGFGRGGSRNAMVEERVAKAMKEESGLGAPSSAWAPDPRTGYYRPANRADEIDPVGLRQMLLNHKAK